MTKISLPLRIIAFSVCFGAVSLIALAVINTNSRNFREKLLDYINLTYRKEASSVSVNKHPVDIESAIESSDLPFSYRKGDWNTYVTSQKYRLVEEDGAILIAEEPEKMNINSFGSFNLNMTYGNSKFTDDKYRLSDDDTPVSRVIDDGLNFERELQLHMEGTMGRRVKVYIDHDSKKEDNSYVMQYKALDDNEPVREINAGEIDISFGNSKYAVYDDTTSKGLGMDLTLKKDKLQIKAFGSITRGETEIEFFRGNSSASYIKLAEYQYMRAAYYQLEPFKRYDNRDTPPTAADNPYDTLITFTSEPANPEYFIPFPVNINPSGFEIYMDDQDPYNNLNSKLISADGGYYDRLASGTDYTINFSTGLIKFIKPVSPKSRIFAVYTLAGGSLNSSDPSANAATADFPGKLFVFIKYGHSINEDQDRDFFLDDSEVDIEDVNGDHRINFDIYEVRSYYKIGDEHLLQDNFRIQFYKENSIMSVSETAGIGKYSIDYTEGLISLNLREPFRYLLGNSANMIYSENQSAGTYTYSMYNIRADYFREARSFQLKHPNIIQNSVRIRINGRDLSSSLYSIDYTSGYLQFTDPNNPVITSETEIEIKYEYLPFSSQSSSLVTGVRADYKFNKNINLGATVLYTREAMTPVIPEIGNEPEQTLLLEADTSVHAGETTLKKLVRDTTGISVRSIPVEITGYAEYAKSYKKVNTFGKALIDDMESNEDLVTLSLSEKDWILSSMPYNTAQGDIPQSDRGLLYYYYYRDPYNPEKLEGPGYTPVSIPYNRKPGPFNIATGHIQNSIEAENTQRSLVMDFNFSTGEYVSVVTRKLSAESVDLSGLQYMEIWYKSAGGTGEVELFVDIGSLNEDSDSDGRLDTEDANNNGFLDYDPAAGLSEDRGYEFNPSGSDSTRIGTGPGLNSFTAGDGILNSEDLNGNGILDTEEDRIRIPGSLTSPYNSANTLRIDMSDTDWKKARIYINKNSSDYSLNSNYYEELLKNICSVRLSLKNAGTASGRIYIDSIRFISSIWGNIEINDDPASSPEEFSLTQIDTLNDSDYRAESFMFTQKDQYESLYGEKTGSELSAQKETALQIEYNLASGKKASAVKKFLKPVDLRSYKTLNAWFNFRNFSPGDCIQLQIGSSDKDYSVYNLPVQYPGLWKEMRLKLSAGSSGTIEKNSTPDAGEPDMKRITYIKLIISQGSGKFWINDIYVSEPEMMEDSAYWYEGDIKFKRPLFYTESRTPVLSDVNIKYLQKGHGSEFSTIGKPADDMMEKYREVFSSARILPGWETKIDFIAENSETDSLNEAVAESKRGKSDKKSFILESGYISTINAVPSARLIYKQDNYKNTKQDTYENTKDEQISSYDTLKLTEDRINTPTLILEEKINNFLGGSLSSTVTMDFFFSDENINRNSAEPDNYSLDQLAPVSESEKRQKGGSNINIDYRSEYLYITPSVNIRSHEIVELKGRSELTDTGIIEDINGGFHFPLIYNKDFKFVDRDKKGSLKFGLINKLLSPSISLDFNYTENKFRDYGINENPSDSVFKRAKNAGTSLSNHLQIPFSFDNAGLLKYIKICSIDYSRSVFLEETEIPYEGEGKSSFDEQYGIRRTYNGLGETSFNLWDYPPWYFFYGRGNYANGRDYTYDKFNKPLDLTDNEPAPNYNNSLRLIDNIGLNSMFDFELMSLNLNVSVNQVSERQIIYGIPLEAVTFNYNSGLSLDLMRIFSSGFFRKNIIGEPYRSANIDITYNFARNMLITSNIQEDSHSPGIGLTFKHGRSSVGLKTSIDFRLRQKKEYISLDSSERDSRDDIYITNMQSMESFHENDRGYFYSVLYETDVIWLYDLFSKLYKLIAYPIFSIEYSLQLNRYNYSSSVSPEPYDQHLVSGKLTVDLHKNVQGGLTGRWALEKYRNRETRNVNREILSYELGFNFSLIF